VILNGQTNLKPIKYFVVCFALICIQTSKEFSLNLYCHGHGYAGAEVMPETLYKDHVSGDVVDSKGEIFQTSCSKRKRSWEENSGRIPFDLNMPARSDG
jgi:hypothetical protein